MYVLTGCQVGKISSPMLRGLFTCGGLAYLSKMSHSGEIDSTGIYMKWMPSHPAGIASSLRFENIKFLHFHSPILWFYVEIELSTIVN